MTLSASHPMSSFRQPNHHDHQQLSRSLNDYVHLLTDHCLPPVAHPHLLTREAPDHSHALVPRRETPLMPVLPPR